MLTDSQHVNHPRTDGGGGSPTCPIHDVTPFTMLDFPGRCAAIVWFSGCNMRCPYCHNPQIVKRKGKRSISDVCRFLAKRQGLLDGVVMSGGEATLYPGLADFIGAVKAMGFAVKLDTNGTRPGVVHDLLEKRLLDYVALDYKAPRSKCKTVTGVDRFNVFERTLELLCKQDTTPFEVRTTVHANLIDENDVSSIIHDLDRLCYQGTYYVQNYVNNGSSTLGRLPDPGRAFDLSLLTTDVDSPIEYRNFDFDGGRF